MAVTTMSFEVRTPSRSAMIDITSQVYGAVRDSRIAEGTATVYVPHTTAGVTINENADPDVVHDVLAALDQAVPCDGRKSRPSRGSRMRPLLKVLAVSLLAAFVAAGCGPVGPAAPKAAEGEPAVEKLPVNEVRDDGLVPNWHVMVFTVNPEAVRGQPEEKFIESFKKDYLSLLGGEADAVLAEGAAAAYRDETGTDRSAKAEQAMTDSMGWLFSPEGDEALAGRKVAYANCLLKSDRDQKVKCYFGSDDEGQIWVNGEVVHETHVARSCQDRQDTFDVELKKGLNPVMVKTSQRSVSWVFVLDVYPAARPAPPYRPSPVIHETTFGKYRHSEGSAMTDATVARTIAGFDARRQRLLESMVPARMTPEQVANPAMDLYGERALACLLLGRHPAVANARLRRTAAWFEHPHPNGRDLKGESDFAAMKLCRVYYLLRGNPVLEPATVESITEFFLSQSFASMYDSENHHLLFRTSRYLMGRALADETFAAYGRTGRDLADGDLRWLTAFIRFRARRGWGEFDSACYVGPVWECLTALHDYAPDPELKRLAAMMLDVILLDMAVDSLDGMYCGAHGRIYANHALDHATEPTYPLQYLYFGNLDPETTRAQPLVDALVSAYRPKPLIVRIALGRREAYANRERKHLFSTLDPLPEKPIPGSIRKLTWYTPRYVLGSVTLQDPYPPRSKAAYYAHHEQHEWDLTITGNTRSRVFTHHPGTGGNEHGYWTGDLDCGCGRFFQHRDAAMAIYDIGLDEPYDFIHAYVPREAFEQVVEEGGWIFLCKSGVFVALKMMGGHEWTTDGQWAGVEVRSRGRRNGAICEVALADEVGTFADFRRHILANRVDFDPRTMSLTYRSARVGVLSLAGSGRRTLDGRPADLDYPTYDCPYLQSAWDSGVIRAAFGSESMTLDFRAEGGREP